jgi:hypothetical protein
MPNSCASNHLQVKSVFLFLCFFMSTMVFALLPGDTFGQTNRNALDFDGSNDKVVIADNNALDLTSNYTLEAWVYPTQFVDLGGIFSKYHSGSANGYFLRLNGTSGGVSFDERTTTGNVLTLNAWNHIAAVNNGGTRKLYINGVEVSLNSSSYNVIANGDPLIIGQDFRVNNSRYFKGKIDEARVWNVVRTQAQIQESYQTMMQGTESGLVAYYRFDQNTAGGTNTGQTTLTNLTSTTGLNGTLENFALTGSTSNWVSGQTFVPLMAATTSVGSITATTASSGGNISDDGGVTITSRGLVFGTSSGPTFGTNFSTGGYSSSTGSYSGQLFSLTPSTTYYVRSYATNSIGTGYGSEVSFTTPSQTLPVLSYSSPITLSVGTPASVPLTNTGGMPDAVQVSTLAGGSWGSADGTGTNARFYAPKRLTIDGSGNLYVADYYNDRIRKIVLATGVVSTLAGSSRGFADGTGTAAKFNNPTAVASDGSGNLYVADEQNHLIRKIVLSTGVVTTIAGSGQGTSDGTGTAAKFRGPSGIDIDVSGNMYVADYYNHRIRKIVLATGVVSTVAGNGIGYADGTGTAALFSRPRGLALDFNGNLYVSEFSNHSIRKIVLATGVVTTLAGNGTDGFVDGTGTAARFTNPGGLAFDGVGNLYVADQNNKRIRKIVLATGEVTTIAGDGTTGTANGQGTTAKFTAPVGVAQDVTGELYVSNDHSIRRLSRYGISPDLPAGLTFNSYTGEISGTPTSALATRSYTITAQNAAGSATTTLTLTVPGPPQTTTNAATNVAATTATLNATVNANGATTTALTIKYSTVQADVVAGNGTSATLSPTSVTGNTNTPISALITGLSPSTTYYFRVSATNATGTTNGSTLMFATGIPAPSISYASPAYSFNVGTPISMVSLTNSGGAADPMNVSNVAGSSFGFANGAFTAAKFQNVQGIASDGSNNLYVVEASGSHRVRKISLDTREVTTVAGNGAAGFNDATGTSAQFSDPLSLTADGNGNLYVADQSNHRIRKIVLSTGQVTTVAGNGTAGFANGIGTLAAFKSPRGVAFDGSGALYVSDLQNNRIRKIVLSTGEVSTFAGSGISGSTDGIGSAAQFNKPGGLVADGSGNLYVSEFGNHRIRKIVLSTGLVSTLAGSTSGWVDGFGSQAKFHNPNGICLDGNGNLYVADQQNNRIRKLVISTGEVTTLVGSGMLQLANGVGTTTSLGMPTGITIDGTGNLYFVDFFNSRIRIISRFSIFPTLPAGLSFNTATGEISGTPTALNSSNTYTVTAANREGTHTTSFTLLVTSPLLTTEVTNIGQTTASSGGEVANTYTNITARGVVWSTSTGPTTALPTKTNDGSTTGTFTSNITGLSPNTTYYMRSYLIYNGGSSTDYGSERTFTTNRTLSMADQTKTFGNPAFFLTAPTSNGTGAWTFTSGTTSVATTSGNTVTIAGAGTSTITATQTAVAPYASISTTFLLTVNGQAPTINLGIPTTTPLKDANGLSITPTSNSGGTVTLTLGAGSTTANFTGTPGNYSLAAVNSTGDLIFEASVPATGNYAAGTLTRTMSVTKNNPTITFNTLSPVTYSSGLTQTLTAIGGGSSAPVTFSVVSGPGTTSGTDGSTLNISAPGDIVVKASQAGDATHNPAPDVVRTLTVNQAAPTITSFTPTSATEGQTVTITGQHFQNVTAVSFGGTAAASFEVVNSTTITAVLATGHTGLVSVTTASGTDTEPGFRYKVTWTGATNAFNTSSNWTGNRPPQTDDDILFSPTAASDLELDGSKTVGHVDFNGSSKSLKLGAYNLTVKGNLTMPGNITGSGKVIMQGGAAQTIRGGGDIPDLEINNSNGVTIDATGDELTVSGTLRSTSGTLTTNGKLRLTSNSGGTARVDVVAGAISGNVIAERYVKRNDNTDGTGRAWRLVSVPVSGTGTMRDFFMNGRAGQDLTLTASRDAETDNSGTPIVGHNYADASSATTAGFDWIGVANSVSSLRYYTGDAGGGSFTSENVPTLSTTYAAADQGYMVFARGDRKLDFPSTTSSGATTFRSTGSMKTGLQTVSVFPASTSKYTLVGNPYMSVLNLDALYTTNSSVINPSFWIWDANISGTNNQGGFVNVYQSGGQWVTNIGTYINPQLLESGMAFFVEPVSSLSTATNISILETHKSSAASAGMSPFSNDKPDDHGRMYIRLERADDKGRRQLIDGVMADFHTSFKETLTDMSDREKLRNGISRGALWIPRDGKLLSGEGLPWPKDVKRSIPLSMSGVGDQTLLVHINPTGMRDRYVKAWLKDNVLKREVEINMSQPTDYDFIGTGRSDWDSTRFEIVYVEAGRPGTGVTLEPDDAAETPSVKLYPNPSRTAEVKLSLRAMAPGAYTVQVLDMTGRLVATSTLEHRSVNGEYRVLSGRLLSQGQYLVRLIDADKQLKETLRMMVE